MRSPVFPPRWLTLAAYGTVALAAACAGGADRALAPSALERRPALAVAGAMPPVRFSELHYDDVSTDNDERIEISGPAGTDLTGWQIVLYNGANGLAYRTTTLSGTLPATCGARGVRVEAYPTDGIQNGSPDGMALVDPANTVVEFLSYEGDFVALDGPAQGMRSTSIGAATETNGTPEGSSIARSGGDLWTASTTHSFGACNDADEVPPAVVASVVVSPATASVVAGATQAFTATAYDATNQAIPGVAFAWESDAPAVATINATGIATGVAAGSATITARAPNGVAGTAALAVTAAPPGGLADVVISEIHYDNASTDVGEAIEVEGPAGTALSGWSLVLYNGSNGASYGTLPLAGTIAASCDGRGVAFVNGPAGGIQNGNPDAVALVGPGGQVVQFISYGGSFAATNGPAVGRTSTDIGVAESGSTPAGRSLQRARNGQWFGPATATFGACNPATPPPPQSGITFGGRLASDPALPVGFQDQIFATLRDGTTGAAVPTTFTWVSETPAIATIDARGVITARAAGTAVVRATAADGTTNTLSLPTEVAPSGDAALYRNALAFGVPTDATPANDLRVSRPQYELSYDKSRNIPNWVAYHLSKATRGDLPGYRCDCFSTDPEVTGPGEVGITTADYTGSGFDRGHMVRSNDRELGRFDQATTYYLSNIVPQYANNNQGRWGDLETHLQAIADGPALPEVYIFAGARGEAGRIADGRIAVPTHVWKVAVVLPAGMTPASVDEASDIIELIAVDMPNVADLPRDGDWAAHRTTVDAIEAATGYDVLSALPNLLETIVESGDRKPTARIAGDGLAGGAEGQTLVFDGTASSDPDVGGPLDDALSYFWTVNGAAAGIQPTLSRTFADDGAYAVRLIVADRFGWADTTSATVTVTNVAPAVQPFAGATILRGETYRAAGSFADPGDDTWTATVDYGAGPTPLPLTGTTFQLAHAYATAGTFTVTVAVRDDDAGVGSRSATVVVLTAAQGVADLAAQVAALASAGTLSKGEASSLDAKLDAAARQLADGRADPAVNQLAAFVHEVEAMVRAGRLAAAEGGRLVAYAQRVIASAAP